MDQEESGKIELHYIERIPEEDNLRDRVIAFVDYMNNNKTKFDKFKETKDDSLGVSLGMLENWFSIKDLQRIAKASKKKNKDNLVFWF